MFLIPGKLVALVTFPGIIVHELAHIFLAKLVGIKVAGAKLLSLGTGNTMGYVLTEKQKHVWKQFLVTFGPFFVNSIVAVLLSMVYLFVKNVAFLNILLIWLAFSVGMHAFPSTGDAKALFNETVDSIKRSRFWNAVFLPFVGFIYLGAILSIFWANLIYAGLIFYGTTTVLGSSLDFSSGITHKYENQYFSFNYPATVRELKDGSDYDEIVASFRDSDQEVYFLSDMKSYGVIVYGSKEDDFNIDLELWGELHASIDLDVAPGFVESKQLVQKKSGVWYEIYYIKKSDSGKNLYIIEDSTSCHGKLIKVNAFGEKYETKLIDQIVESFYCKGGS